MGDCPPPVPPGGGHRKGRGAPARRLRLEPCARCRQTAKRPRGLDDVLKSGYVTTVLLVRHGLTATTGQVLTGWTPGIGLDDRGRAQARTLGARIAPVALAAIVTSPLDRCRQTVAELVAARNGHAGPAEPGGRDRVGECRYGDWTGKPLAELAKDPLWPVVQNHPSAV